MRLHRLQVRAFGSFGGEETVDFDRLSDAGIFLLHGPTGAGKTTILDAVSFALFGKVPGARGAAESLRSDHASLSITTEVRLEVTIRSRRYRIMRQPRQLLPKRRGTGLREHAPNATVEELVDGAWIARAAKPTDADELLRDQLQMAAEQFHQIVMLPQGDFARFLRASPEDRRGVLEQLFATERFADVEKWLKARADQTERAVHEATEQLARTLAVVATITGVDPYPDDAPIAGAVGWLRARSADADAAARAATVAEAAARAVHDIAKQAHVAAVEMHGRQRRHVDASRERAALVEHDAEHRRRLAALEQARRAMPVLPLIEIGDQATAVVGAAEAELHAARRRLTGPNEILAVAPVAALVDRAEELAGVQHHVDALVSEADELQRRAGKLAELDRALAEAEAGCREREERRAQLPALRVRLDENLRAARDASVRVDALDEAVVRLRARHEAALERDALMVELVTVTDARRAATDRAQAAYAAWLALLDTRIRTQAAALAARLEPGLPCPVCGSAEHPQPATEGHELVTDVDLEAARVRQESAKAAEESAMTVVTGVETRLAAARATADATPVAELAEALDAHRRDLAAVQRLVARVAPLEQELAEFDLAARTLDREVDDLREVLARSREHRSGLDAVVIELRQRLSAALAGSPDLDHRRAVVTAERAAITAVLECDARLDTARRDLLTATDRAVAGAVAHGFADVGAARAAAVSDATLVDLETDVKAYEKKLAEVEGDLKRPELAAAAASPAVDLAGAAATASNAEQAWSDASTRAKNAARTALELEAHRVETGTALDHLVPLVAEAERTRHLATLALGEDRRVEHRMRLSTYVLAARLEQVAIVASERLRRMSNDRYTIVHTDHEGDGRRKGGLGLRVVDSWTSTERDTNSLSGGESFFTSLALALGVADVVAAEAGGIQMETMFIDEGFGTLDDETLHDVLDVLDGLRSGGRSVGIVSHVTDLRSRVTAQVEVVKGSEGSRIRVAGV